MVRVESGTYGVSQTILMTDLCGDYIVRPALGTLDEQLKGSAESRPESVGGNTLSKDDGATSA
jgi:hypothetical protein